MSSCVNIQHISILQSFLRLDKLGDANTVDVIFIELVFGLFDLWFQNLVTSQEVDLFSAAVEVLRTESLWLSWACQGPVTELFYTVFAHSAPLFLAGGRSDLIGIAPNLFIFFLHLYWRFQLNCSDAKQDMEFPLSSSIMHIHSVCLLNAAFPTVTELIGVWCLRKQELPLRGWFRHLNLSTTLQISKFY